MAGDMKKPRVSEIAKLAGVSTATVSKVINGREGVSSSTRARIEKIMEESGYSKSLVTTKTSQTIELVLTEVMANGINAMIAETTEYVKSMPIGITITQTGRGKRSEESFREILNRNPLGVILLLSNATEREKHYCVRATFPSSLSTPSAKGRRTRSAWASTTGPAG